MEVKEKKRVGLVYDDRMCKHHTPDGEDHPENPLRIKAIWEKLQSAGIPQRCVVMSAKEAEDRHIGLVHTKKHIDLIRKISSKAYDSKRDKIAARLNSIYLNKGSSEAAYLAAGSVIEASERVATGELNSAVAIVRPPGHHAEADEAMGFCLYNNVAIAGSVLLNEKPELGIKKILIVDWDVHHGNGTQKMFWKDPRVLFFSVHRFDFGTFYPTGDDGSHTQVGEDLGAGYNINVPWEHGQCGDADYLAAWEHILIPVARAFGPDIVLISGGFDAAVGDPLGGCRVTPYGYSVMMKKLMEFAQGKIMMALEGGYNLDSVANSVLACVKALLDDKPIIGSSEVYPFDSTWRVIQAVRGELSAFWPTLADELPAKLLLKKVSPVELISSSDSDAENDEEVSVKPTCSETVAVVNDLGVVENVIRDFSVLKVAETAHDQVIDGSVLWRSVLSKIYVWYGSFGSNMWKPRLLCYIEGGKVDGMQKSCSGSMDKTPPKSVMWKTVPHRLFFGRSHTDTWGSGGVAFLHPQSSTHDVAYMCVYKITLEQFNDILLQENGQNVSTISPLFDLNALDSVVQSNFIPLESLKGGWYSNVLYLGTEDGLPILTMTCPLSNVENFRSGKHPLNAPPKNYMNTLVKGLVEGKQLSEEEAISYINDVCEMDSALLLAKGNKQKKFVAARRGDEYRRPEIVDNDRIIRQRVNTSRDKQPVVKTHPHSSNIPFPPTRSSPLNPNRGIIIEPNAARINPDPPTTSPSDGSFSRKRKRFDPGDVGGSESLKAPSWEISGFVKPTDPELAMALVDEISNVPALNNLGVYGKQSPFLGLGFIERIVNCDTLKLMQEAGESYQQALSRLGSSLSEVATCAKVLGNVLELKLIEAKHQFAQSDSQVQELSVDVENKVAQLKEMGQKLEDANARSESLLKERDNLFSGNERMKSELKDLANRLLALGEKYKESVAREKVLSVKESSLAAEVVRLTRELGDSRASNRAGEDQAISRGIEDYLFSKDFEALVVERSLPYLKRGMFHAARIFIARGKLDISNQEVAELLSVGSQQPELLPIHARIPFDEEELSYIIRANPDWIAPIPDLGNVVSCLEEIVTSKAPATSTILEDIPESAEGEVDSRTNEPAAV